MKFVDSTQSLDFYFFFFYIFITRRRVYNIKRGIITYEKHGTTCEAQIYAPNFSSKIGAA